MSHALNMKRTVTVQHLFHVCVSYFHFNQNELSSGFDIFFLKDRLIKTASANLSSQPNGTKNAKIKHPPTIKYHISITIFDSKR